MTAVGNNKTKQNTTKNRRQSHAGISNILHSLKLLHQRCFDQRRLSQSSPSPSLPPLSAQKQISVEARQNKQSLHNSSCQSFVVPRTTRPRTKEELWEALRLKSLSRAQRQRGGDDLCISGYANGEALGSIRYEETRQVVTSLNSIDLISEGTSPRRLSADSLGSVGLLHTREGGYAQLYFHTFIQLRLAP